jgi:hypothetical protein
MHSSSIRPSTSSGEMTKLLALRTWWLTYPCLSHQSCHEMDELGSWADPLRTRWRRARLVTEQSYQHRERTFDRLAIGAWYRKETDHWMLLMTNWISDTDQSYMNKRLFFPSGLVMDTLDIWPRKYLHCALACYLTSWFLITKHIYYI